MTTEEKVGLVSVVRDRCGLEPALRALGLPRSTWYYHTTRRVAYAEKYAHLRGPLEAIARAHPEYGYRRATPEFRETHGHWVSRKVVQRLHLLWDLPVKQAVKAPKPSAVRRGIEIAGPQANLLVGRPKSEIGPLEVLYTDFTELIYAGGVAKASLLPVLDYTTKLVAGFAVGEGANSALALSAWSMAKNRLAVWRASLEGVVVHHDQDPVFTGYAWAGRLLADGVRISYALRGARENGRRWRASSVASRSRITRSSWTQSRSRN